MTTPRLRLEPWDAAGLELLRRTNTPEMTEHLGGPETEEQLVRRQARYLTPASGGMYRVVLADTGVTAGTIGFWEHAWNDDVVWETGWGVFPEFQGRGIAAGAAREIVALARATGAHRYLHAFPGVDHPASNAVCRRAGFELVATVEFEYPKGCWMRSNDWRVDLEAALPITAD